MEGGDEVASLEKGFMSAGVEPGKTATKFLDVECARFHVRMDGVDDFQFAPGGWFEGFGDGHHIGVEEQAGLS